MRRPSACVPKNVANTVNTTTDSVAGPRSVIWLIERRNPSKTTPTRMSRFAANFRPGRVVGGTNPKLPSKAPMTTATTNRETDGTAALMTVAPAIPRAAAARPGARSRPARSRLGGAPFTNS